MKINYRNIKYQKYSSNICHKSSTSGIKQGQYEYDKTSEPDASQVILNYFKCIQWDRLSEIQVFFQLIPGRPSNWGVQQP